MVRHPDPIGLRTVCLAALSVAKVPPRRFRYGLRQLACTLSIRYMPMPKILFAALLTALAGGPVSASKIVPAARPHAAFGCETSLPICTDGVHRG
jgi:hypothetical protein